MKRDYYLNSVSQDTAIKKINELYQKLHQTKTEIISVYDSLNRVPAQSVFALVSSPNFNASAMDGFATKSSLTHEVSETNPIVIEDNDFIPVNTGNSIPLEFDTVIMIEDVEFVERGIKIIKSSSVYEHIRPIGEDIVKGELVVPKYKKITPIMISALLSSGVTTISVIKKPSVLLIPTGDEIIQSSQTIKKGEIIDSNSYFMQNELQELGCTVTLLSPCKDEYNLLEEVILSNTNKYDLIIIGAGSSAGSKDFAYQVIKNNGILHVHGINIKPGKPSLIGEVNESIIIGIPGYPVSTYIAFKVMVEKLISLMLHQPQKKYKSIEARLTKKIYSSLKNKEYVRVQLGNVNNQLCATPLSRGAGVTMSLVKSDGFLIIDQTSEGFEKGELVRIQTFNEELDYKDKLISIGSHDIILDIVNDMMNDKGFELKSSHVGSFGGILAISNKSSHISPVHILHDDQTYNSRIINEYLNDEYHLIEFVKRKQGLYLKKGNPKNIQSINDIKNNRFVNRQRGSGTRILFDQLLSKHDIDQKHIIGYQYELSTHTQVAVSVLSERSDVGLGIESVAKRYELDFVELALESYDLLVHRDTLKLESYIEFINIIQSNEFKEKIEKLGYQLDAPGRIIK